RGDKPGLCPRCGMRLTADLPEHVDYRFSVSANPRAFSAGQPVDLRFRIGDPKTGKPVSRYEVIHEKLFHMFLISRDLQWFAHEHPEPLPDGTFRYRAAFPKPGAYRLAADFFPTGGTPQFLVRTLITAGASPAEIAGRVELAPDLAPKRGENMEVELVTEPPQPLAGKETLMFFRVKPGDGLEQYLGAWGHMLAASGDLIDVIHMHPRYINDGPVVQFNLLFPREAMYRVWVQFQRKGVVNTIAFTVPVKALR
ncbi:MAG: heavy metal-binding domain-containing protein, partial [Bryobacteraceae bacterium]